MARRFFTDADRDLIVRLKEVGKQKWREIAEVMAAKLGDDGVSIEAVRWQYKQAKREGEVPPATAAMERAAEVERTNLAAGREVVTINRPQFTGKADELAGVCYVQRKPIGLNEALENYNVDRDVWRVKNWEAVEWNGPAKLGVKGAEVLTITDLFRIKIVFERIPGIEALKNVLDKVVGDKMKTAPKWKVAPLRKKKGSTGLLALNVPDLHLGKLAWPDETGGPAYDLKIAGETFKAAIVDLVKKARAAGWEFDKVLLPIGNDFLNSDSFVGGKAAASTKGTLQDEDGRWQKSFVAGFNLVEEAIAWVSRELRVPVEVVIVPGNHDFERIFYLGHAIDVAFRNHPNVEVDNRPVSRKYFAHGKTLIGLTHGDKEKPDQLPLLMAGKNDLTAYNCREWFLGHLHHRRRRSYETECETGPVVLRWFASLSPPDSWHSHQGYEMSARCAEAFFYGDRGHVEGFVTHFPD